MEFTHSRTVPMVTDDANTCFLLRRKLVVAMPLLGSAEHGHTSIGVLVLDNPMWDKLCAQYMGLARTTDWIITATY